MWVYISDISAFLESHENLFVIIKKYWITLQIFNVNTQFCFVLSYILTLLEVTTGFNPMKKVQAR